MIIALAGQALMISGFVVAMMLVVEYLNVLSGGAWRQKLSRQRWGQYVLAAILGAVPGCLGAFAVVAMYSHGLVTLGAVVAAMIATSGDEAFVMLAMIPDKAFLAIGVLVVLGVVVGIVVDAVARRHAIGAAVYCEGFQLHGEEQRECFPRGRVIDQWKQCSPVRGILGAVLTIFVAAVVTGQLGPAGWDWLRVTLLVVSLGALFIVSTVPDHFLEDHLWGHVARNHAPRVFLWTFGALVAMHFLTEVLAWDHAIGQGKWIVLLAACLIGLIPESGPHMVFVTLYAQGAIPFSILLASSVVQDGHGMLPMLAHSRHGFAAVKAINFIAGVSFGAAALALGY